MHSQITLATIAVSEPGRLKEEHYRYLYDDLRAIDPDRPGRRLSLRRFVALIAEHTGRPGLSIAYWSKYERGLIRLSSAARDELRAVMGWPAIRPLGADVTRLQTARRRRPRKTIHLCPEAWERLNAARQEQGLSWEEFLQRAEEATS
jgi:hypothetical protein